MAAPRHIRTRSDLAKIREVLNTTRERARNVVARIVGEVNFLERMKFEPLGCDPLDPTDAQNLAEQIDQQAIYEAAADALDYLCTKYPDCEWMFAPGAHSSGHDIQSNDRLVAAEVFAAVKPDNNRKLAKDIEKVATFAGPHRYVFYRSPGHARSERRVSGVVVVSLGPREC